MFRPAVRHDRVLVNTALQIIAALVGGLVLGLIVVVLPPILAISLIVGVAFLGVALRHPELFVLGLVAATSTAIPLEDVPVIMNIGPGRIFISDLVFLAPFGLILLRATVERDFQLIGTRLDIPLVLFVLLVYIATWLGFSRAMPYHMSISQIFASPPSIISLAIPKIRVIAYYLIFFVATNIIRSEEQLDWLLKGLSTLAVAVGFLVIAQFAAPGLALFQVGRVGSLFTEGSRYGDITRITDFPGEALILIMFCVATANLLHRQPVRVWDWLLWVPLGAALLLTFNRNFWASIGLSALILAHLSDRIGWQRLALFGLTGALLVGIVVAASVGAPESRLAHLTSATGERIVSIVEPDTYTEGASIQFRVIETGYALQQIARTPVFGVGLGGYYRPYDSRLDWEEYDGRGFIHNGHLWLILQAGFAGYLCFVWLSVVFIVRGFRHWRTVKQPRYRIVLLGFVAAYLGIAFGAIVNPVYMQASWAPLLGLMMGINEVILRFNTENDRQIGDTRRLWYVYRVKRKE